ncbi:MAG TPA: 4a-hydroxytetrahydrobiopterin dehydratase [Bryobacteraceae bacterium]|jgi:4a-hydroxytetrahydrobiopterin dehydratase|nr:4a-hydroxytetrahydrobiopterin dehydratase [Bryobacteraceae bacterium]
MSSLADQRCVPCRGGVPPLEGEALEKLSAQLRDWKVIEGRRIQKTFLFPDFKTALDFVNRIGEVAEAEGHHPDLCLAWGRVDATTYTHKINGLTESDFVLAAKIDRLYFSR